MPKFDMKEHDKRMRKILESPQVAIPFRERLREVAASRRRVTPPAPRLPKIGR